MTNAQALAWFRGKTIDHVEETKYPTGLLFFFTDGTWAESIPMQTVQPGREDYSPVIGWYFSTYLARRKTGGNEMGEA